MDLVRHLRYFVTVAEERHFGHAADELGMTQPPLSQGIQRLERQWGVRLFDRGPRGVRLTPAGAALLPAARHVLAGVRDLGDDVSRVAAEVQPVRVALARDVAHAVPDLLTAAAQAVAPIPLVPLVVGTVDAVDHLGSQAVDLAVVVHPAVLDGVEPGPVRTLPRTMAVAAHVPGGVGEPGLPVAMTPRADNPPAHDQTVDALRRAGHDGRVREVRDLAEQRTLAAAGATCVLVPTTAVPAGLRPLPGVDVDLRLRLLRPRLAAADERREAAGAALQEQLDALD
ncbi:LysR family transcriptional regulator [Janibacter alkaliphilus]|uniref:DNA-binding transcriptional LysR family regulator n=1 Tax=Janibacter alkaliphilus TaxID=1069963 RepID=A0A852X3J7_9MICO|nr:DNA-binding transcriptional LysR family regulator [Janibacter alkaliphilus]